MHSNEMKELVIFKRNEGKSLGTIAKECNLSKSTVQSMVKPKLYQSIRKRGPKLKIDKKLSTRIKRCTESLISDGQRVTSRKLSKMVDLNVSLRTTQRHMKRLLYKYKAARAEIVLGKNHRDERVRICKGWLRDRIDWDKVVFSDEKRFNMDGPDNWMTYSRLGRRVCRNKRQGGGGSLMVWGMVLPSGELIVRRVLGIQNSVKYEQMLRNHVVPYLRQALDDDFVFQQDNCAIHISRRMMEFFDEVGFNLLEWPSRSPDLNIIENVWSMLSSHVYDGPQPRNLAELEQRIYSAVDHLNSEKKGTILHLYDSMINRICDILKSDGKKIKY